MKQQPIAVFSAVLRRPLILTPPRCHHAAFLPARYSTTSANPPLAKPASPVNRQTPPSALAVLPLSDVIRSYGITWVSSSPPLLKIGTAFLRTAVTSPWALLNAERNPLLKWVITKTFYDQFCGGGTEQEVKASIEKIKSVGYDGVILEYGSEVLEEDANLDQSKKTELMNKSIQEWKNGLLATMKMCQPNDFMGLKWSGMGSEALKLLKQNKDPLPQMWEAMTALCDAAVERGVLLLPAAEAQNANAAVDRWATMLAEIYNKKTPGRAIVYHTFQCYLKSTPHNLMQHLIKAKEQGFTLGVKLVRGAYLETEQRKLIWDTKEETDRTYDTLLEDILNQRYGKLMESPEAQKSGFPKINIVIASHNLASVQKANAIQEAQVDRGEKLVRTTYATLQGMADEVSCELIRQRRLSEQSGKGGIDAPIVKSAAWGSFEQCTHYLLRRAGENKDAMSRTIDTRKAMGKEMRRRFWATLGWT